MRYLAFVCALLLASTGYTASLEVVSQGVVSDEKGVSNAPLVVINDSGYAIALWQCLEGQQESLKISSRKLHGAWTAPKTLYSTRKKITHAQLVMNGCEEVALLWVEKRGVSTSLMSSFCDAGGTWTEVQEICKKGGIRSAHISLSDAGQVVAVWESGTHEEAQVESARAHVGEAWSNHSVLSRGDGGAHTPRVVINASGHIRVLWEEREAIVGVSAFFGEAFSEVKRVSDEASRAVRPQLYMNRLGQAVAIWEKSEGYRVSLQGAYYKPGQGWTAPTDLSAQGEIVSEPCGVINGHGDAMVVWRGSSAEGVHVCVSSATSVGAWSDPLTLSLRGENSINPHVVLNDQEAGLVIWRVPGFEASSIQGASFTSGKEWSFPFPLIEGPARVTQAALSLNNEGSGVLVWRQKDAGRSLIHSQELSFGSLEPKIALTTGTQEASPQAIPPPEESMTPKPDSPVDMPGDRKGVPDPSEFEKKESERSKEVLDIPSEESPFEEEEEAELGEPVEVPKEEGPAPAHGEAELSATLVAIDVKPEPLPAPVLEVCCCRPYRWVMEVRGGGYRPTDRRFHKHFGEFYPTVGFQVGYLFCPRWDVVATVDYMRRSGRRFHHLEPSRMELIPISALLRYHFYQSASWRLYAGVGPRYFLLKSKNFLTTNNSSDTSEGIGVVGEVGVLFEVCSSVSVDLFVSYAYGSVSGPSKKVGIKSHTVDAGGLQAGLGLGFRF